MRSAELTQSLTAGIASVVYFNCFVVSFVCFIFADIKFWERVRSFVDDVDMSISEPKTIVVDSVWPYTALYMSTLCAFCIHMMIQYRNASASVTPRRHMVIYCGSAVACIAAIYGAASSNESFERIEKLNNTIEIANTSVVYFVHTAPIVFVAMIASLSMFIHFVVWSISGPPCRRDECMAEHELYERRINRFEQVVYPLLVFIQTTDCLASDIAVQVIATILAFVSVKAYGTHIDTVETVPDVYALDPVGTSCGLVADSKYMILHVVLDAAAWVGVTYIHMTNFSSKDDRQTAMYCIGLTFTCGRLLCRFVFYPHYRNRSSVAFMYSAIHQICLWILFGGIILLMQSLYWAMRAA